MIRLTELLALFCVVAAALLVAGCTSPVEPGPATTPTAAGPSPATGTAAPATTPAAAGTATPAGTAATTGAATVPEGTGGGTGGSADGGAGEAETVLDEEMNESTVAVKLNSRFALELAENPSTGYAWNLSTTEGLRVVSDEYIPPGGAAVGAEGTHRWEIDATAEGLQAIEGVYRRPWETASPGEKTFTVEVAVEP